MLLGVGDFASLCLAWVNMERGRLPLSLPDTAAIGPILSVAFALVVIFQARPNRDRAPRSGAALRRPLVIFAAVFCALFAVWNVMQNEWSWSSVDRAEIRLQDSRPGIEAKRPTGGTPPAQGPSFQSSRSSEKQVRPLTGKTAPATPTRKQAGTKHPPNEDFREPYRLGPKQALVDLLVFYDYECEGCLRIEGELQQLFKQYGRIMSISVRHYPQCTACNSLLRSNKHPNACRAARAAEAAGILKGSAGFWQMHFWLLKHKGRFTLDELKQGLRELGYDNPREFLETMNGGRTLRYVLQDITEADALQIEGTPALFMNGVRLRSREVENAIIRVVQGVTKQGIETVTSKYFSKELQLAALTATVRIVNLSRNTQGSGVIVGSNGPFTYILSAKHFLEKTDRLEIHTFSKESYPQAENVERSGKVIAELEDADLCLIRVSMRNRGSGSVRLCPPRQLPKEKAFPVLTVGCSGGDAPTCRIGRVNDTKIVRKEAEQGTSLAWVLASEPARGRSGGALIDRRGYLVGVGSGTSNGKAYYCHAHEIYRFLRRNGFRWLYQHADAESRGELPTSTPIRRPRNP